MKIDLSTLDDELRRAMLDIASLVKGAGGRALMVGGAVRDLLSGVKDVKDVDLEVFGLSPDELQLIIGAKYDFDPCGVSFGVLKLHHLDIDVSLPRRETKRGTGHKGFLIDSDPSLSVSEAATRRDFTINAIYYDPLDERIEDPHGGEADLRGRILRHVSAKFAEDPLRVLRGVQFIARFDLSPAPETVEVCRAMTMEGLPAERLFEEWSKLLLKGKMIGKGLAFLRDTGWVRFFPELERLIGCEQDPHWHPEGDVWNHTCLCLDAFARRRTGDPREDLVVGLAVLCHDFGKPATTAYDPVRRRIRSLGHDEAGVEPTLSFLRRLTNEERLLKEVPPLVQCHMQPFAMWKGKVGDSAVRRLAARVVRIDRLIRVARADDEGRPPECSGGSSGGEDLAWLAAAAERLKVADAAPRPLLMGRDLIAMGFKPSPKFGEWLAACYEAQLDGAFTDHAGAVAYFSSFPH
jgi:tRNA nucleotidyltransferase (CCA-adding enzyme)